MYACCVTVSELLARSNTVCHSEQNSAYMVWQNKVAPKGFRCFLGNHLEFYFEILQIYFLKCSTSNCHAKSNFTW